MIRNSKGFTLVETLVAASLAGVTLLFASQFFKTVKVSNDKVSEDIIKTMSQLHLERALNFDISNSRYSLNLLNVSDDENENFFDFYFDIPCMKNCSRTLTLEMVPKEKGVSRTFYFMIADRHYNREVMFHPQEAFEEDSTSFVSLNQNNFLSNRANTPWRKDKLLLLYSPLPVRADNLNPETNPPKHIAYLGWITNMDSQALLQREIIEDEDQIYFQYKDPRDGQEIFDESDALLRMPYVHGLSNDVLMTNVRVVRYQIKTELEKGKLVGKLYRGVRIVGSRFAEKVIGSGVKSLKFIRRDVSIGEIEVQLESDQ